MGDALRALGAGRDAQCPCATQQGSMGAHGQLAWSSLHTLRSTIPRRPLPASWTDSEQCWELGKTGSRAWYPPGLPDLLELPAFFQFSMPQNVFSLPPFSFFLAFSLLSPGLFSLSLSWDFIVLGRSCTPLNARVGLDRQSQDKLESVLILTKASWFYLLSSERLRSQSRGSREPAALSGADGGKARGA